jgi:hypothetical protein
MLNHDVGTESGQHRPAGTNRKRSQFDIIDQAGDRTNGTISSNVPAALRI